MKILITGICGFTGSTLARELAKEGNEVCGLDNFLREGSRGNVEPLKKLGIRVEEGDIRNEADLAKMPKADWVLDCAAEPSVLAGVGGGMGSYELMDHNLIGTIRVLELCKKIQAGLILLSTSRVYAVTGLSNLKVEVKDGAFRLAPSDLPPPIQGTASRGNENPLTRGNSGLGLRLRLSKREQTGISEKGISESFSTEPPLSLYGASKRCAEVLAMEYGDAFGFPVWINRCGVLAGKGQFGKADQGIFSFWIRSWRENRPLRYIGFGGRGEQVRDCLHPKDLVPVLKKQMNTSVNVKVNVKEDGKAESGKRKAEKSDGVDRRICNFGGGVGNSCSLAQLSEWCEKKFGARKVESDPKPRPYDLPWVVMDSTRAEKVWGFEVRTRLETIFEEIAGS